MGIGGDGGGWRSRGKKPCAQNSGKAFFVRLVYSKTLLGFCLTQQCLRHSPSALARICVRNGFLSPSQSQEQARAYTKKANEVENWPSSSISIFFLGAPNVLRDKCGGNIWVMILWDS